MKTFIKMASLAVLGAAIATPALAAYQPQGLFGGRNTPDGALNLRKTTIDTYSPVRGQSVADRPRVDYAPTPIDIGSFQFFPQLNVGGYYDNNVFAANTNEQDDFVWKVSPSASLLSDWGRHALAVTAIGDANIYTDNSDEDNYNGAIQVEGRYDIAQKTWLAGNLSHQRATESRGSANTPGAAAEPTTFDLTRAGVEAYRGQGLLSATLGYDYAMYDYGNPDAIGGGVINQDGRDRQHHMVSGELGYKWSGNFQPFIRADISQRDYDNNAFRDSDGYGAVVGAKADFGGKVSGEAFVGYAQREYDNFASGTVDMVDYGATLLWNATSLTSVEAEIGRTIEETTVGGTAAPTAAVAYISTGSSATITHELLRNVLVEAHTTYTNNDYHRGGAREDDILGAGFGSRYFVSRNLYLDGVYDYTQRDSNVAGADYDRHVLYARAGVQY